jgi:hypothetical protein
MGPFGQVIGSGLELAFDGVSYFARHMGYSSYFLDAGLPDGVDRPECLEKVFPTRRPYAGDVFQSGCQAFFPAARAMVGNGEAMGLVADALHQEQTLRTTR